MGLRAILVVVGVGFTGLAAFAPQTQGVPTSLNWAYPDAPSASIPDFGKGPFQVPGSARTVSLSEATDDNHPVDWFPDEHPPAPAIVGLGHKGGPTPCAECHLYDGHGFPGAADIAGLPSSYIIEQIQAFRVGERRSAQRPDRPDTTEMIKVAKAVSDEEAKAAADWFASLPRHAFVRVIETDMAPVTKATRYGWLELAPGGGVEPIGARIIEVAEDVRRMYLADPHNGIIDYVPRGAIARGAALVRNGGPGGQPCATCHGGDLGGMQAAPPLAGRAATYLSRMLWDIKTGARAGPSVAQMQVPTRSLTNVQIIDIAAYLASLTPRSRGPA